MRSGDPQNRYSQTAWFAKNIADAGVADVFAPLLVDLLKDCNLALQCICNLQNTKIPSAKYLQPLSTHDYRASFFATEGCGSGKFRDLLKGAWLGSEVCGIGLFPFKQV